MCAGRHKGMGWKERKERESDSKKGRRPTINENEIKAGHEYLDMFGIGRSSLLFKNRKATVYLVGMLVSL